MPWILLWICLNVHFLNKFKKCAVNRTPVVYSCMLWRAAMYKCITNSHHNITEFPQTIQHAMIYKSIHPSTHISASYTPINPPILTAISRHMICSPLYPSLLPFLFMLPSSISLSFPPSFSFWVSSDINAPLQWAVSFFPDILMESDNLGRSLYVSSSLASQLWTPHTHDNQNGCHGEKLPRKISIWLRDRNRQRKHSSQTCCVTVTLVFLLSRN